MSGEAEGESRGSERGPGSRYSLYVGLAFLVLIAIATVNTIRTGEGGLLGAAEDDPGSALAEFAVPELLGSTEGDANIYQDDCATGEIPCPEAERRTPACQVDLPQVIRVCDYFDRPLVLSFWFSQPSGCPPTQDVIDRVARRFEGRVGFLSIAVRGDREQMQATVRERGWRLPVGWDRDGAVSNLYRVGVCPTVAFAYPGGILHEAKLGSDELTEEALVAEVERLVRASRRRAEVSR